MDIDNDKEMDKYNMKNNIDKYIENNKWKIKNID